MKFRIGQQVKVKGRKVFGVVIGAALQPYGEETYTVYIQVEKDIGLMPRDQLNWINYGWEDSDVYNHSDYEEKDLIAASKWETSQLLTHKDERIRKAVQMFLESTRV